MSSLSGGLINFPSLKPPVNLLVRKLGRAHRLLEPVYSRVRSSAADGRA